MIGLDVADKHTAHEWMDRSFHRGVLTLTAGAKAIRLCPPLTISREEVELGFEVMRAVLLEIERDEDAPVVGG